ncbi:prepilin-type N-terminal cleavage/methylation domain-containing protein [Micavibrio aeruginosavorus]|uniref:Prepilin-type N-terminal cleavage/methylation domain protein n=1 Tax=Micavibrio aeruginosavorus (strain ARL-13) TaxID=856793 RepID=G2KPM9_MICAA|nr:prepilin-type N-terminal cleavage/methylation domain-containing protein [Micavibrio aeruginosavorus]AEP09848.1 prepilin-type N-terminal cleavage/methylation domain protein [Micavibrio aeruginosavorus ARL-13]
MTKSIHTTNRSQAGFTLVELAVVMIIIGLLIGGVLKGQELVNNAQIAATVAQVKSIDAATTTFRDMYNAMPGDMLTPGTRLPNCTTVGACTSPGDGNGRLNSVPSAAPGTEAQRFFVHLAAADVFSGVNPAGGNTAWGGLYPAAKIAGGFFPGYTTGATAADFVANATSALGGHYLTLTLQPNAAPAAANGVISPNQAFRLDSKIDDGNGAAGGVRGYGTGCVNATGGVYDEQSPAKICGLHIRFQG